MKKGLVFMAGILWLSGSPLLGQEPRIEEADLPRWVEEDVINFFNDPSTIHFTARTRIPSTRVVLGDVAALGGPFTIAGEVDGDLVVVNGDLVFESGGAVTGNVLVVGGRVFGEDVATIGGSLRVFDGPLRYVQRGDRISSVGRPQEREGFGPDFPWGDARLVIKAGQNYNRTEGLPVIFGPSFRTAGANPLRLEAFGIWRTEMGFDLDEDDFGYALRAEQALGGRNNIAVGGTLFSTVDPIEDWGITNLEASLTTFILHKDFRDYYKRSGWSAYAQFRFPYTPVEVKAEYFQEDHDFMPVAGPWSVTKNDDPWREQPLVAEGRVRFLEGSIKIDTRNDQNEPSDGWLLQASARRGLGGDLLIPAHLASAEGPPETIDPKEFDTDFLTGFLDLRGYLRINPSASLNLRGVMGGALNDVPLPPQFQHALGGVGSLPGHRMFAQDCGARKVTRIFDHVAAQGVLSNEVFPAYGCDRFALFQAEFRGSLFMDWDFGGSDEPGAWEEDWNWYPNIDFSPNWSAFFDAGQAWNISGGNTDILMDVGLGLFFGDLGLYFAFPLNEDENGGRDGNLFIRLSRRF
ncbi:MAG: polymer-forming cytoskeletal protein [Gemmatimonadota bacterium]